MASAALTYALNNGMTQAQFDQNIFDAVVAAQQAGTSNTDLRIEMDKYGVSPEDVARATGVSAASVTAQYEAALPAVLAPPVVTPPVVTAPAVVAPPVVTAPAVTAPAVTAPSGLLTTPTAPVATPVAVAAPTGLLDSSADDATVTAAPVTPNSAGLTYALNNGMSAAKYYQNIFDFYKNNSGKSDAVLRTEMDKYGISPQDVATATGVPVAGVLSRYNSAAATNSPVVTPPVVLTPVVTPPVVTPPAVTPPVVTPPVTPPVVTPPVVTPPVTPPVVTPPVVTPPVVRPPVTPPVVTPPVVRPPVTPPVVTPPVVRPPVVTPTATGQSAALTYALNNGMTADQYYKNIFDFYKSNSGLSDFALRSEMDRLGVSPADVARATGVTVDSVMARYGSKAATTPDSTDAQKKAQADIAAFYAAQQRLTQTPGNAFLNAPPTLGERFGSYQSIPIGAQYNPAVTPGGASPYSMVMGQMQPFQNPYANFVPGTALGGYNPNLYSDIAKRNADAAVKAAADAKAANDALLAGGSAGPGDATSAAAAASAADSAAAAAASATGTAPGSDGTPGSGAAMGGLITNVFGPDPAGPDEGQVNMMRGEYVIKKSSVNKYGRGLLDMINEGKVPAKKIRSLLD
jgi:hypothetical protein